MIGYTLVGTNDLERAKSYYDALFAVVGAGRGLDIPGYLCAWGEMTAPMFGVCKPHDGAAATVGNGTMIALAAADRAHVAALHATALELGGSDEGAPGVRGEDGPQAFYGAYFRDLDGNKVCAFCMGPA